ncbi:MAG: class IV adenylate cyclase [Bacteroidota bacterium]|nr:class IV adenylate cyclase [Bacteroidota bacterium]
MPSNLELKAKIASISSLSQIAEEIGATYITTMLQEDTYFYSTKGRLKLRVINEDKAELIFYDRDETTNYRFSEYQIYRVADKELMRKILEHAYGIRSIVKKQRQLFTYKNCRIHIDQVDGLGDFLELEVILSKSDNDGEELMKFLSDKFSSQFLCIIQDSYSDILEKEQNKGGKFE